MVEIESIIDRQRELSSSYPPLQLFVIIIIVVVVVDVVVVCLYSPLYRLVLLLMTCVDDVYNRSLLAHHRMEDMYPKKMSMKGHHNGRLRPQLSASYLIWYSMASYINLF